jgi:SAM-dependent methyltransferase
MLTTVKKAFWKLREWLPENDSFNGEVLPVTWSRVVMNQACSEWVSELEPDRLDVLEVSGKGWADRGFKSYQSVEYPDFDICERALPDNFDLVIAEQVFEHLLWPYRAGKNVFQMVRPGGHFLVTTPFLYRIHNYPVDCSRWTELGMRHFLAECGFDFESVRTAAWGNRECVKAFLEGYVHYRPAEHSLVNESEYPVVVWALAQRSKVSG